MRSVTTCMAFAVVIVLALGLTGCEGKYRKTALQAYDRANAADNDVAHDMWKIAMVGQLGLAKTRVEAAKTTEERAKILNEYTNVVSDLTWLYRQHERAGGLKSQARIYIKQTESWLEMAGDKLGEAKAERDAMKQAATSQPSVSAFEDFLRSVTPQPSQ